jgi:hypothetical protein
LKLALHRIQIEVSDSETDFIQLIESPFGVQNVGGDERAEQNDDTIEHLVCNEKQPIICIPYPFITWRKRK